MGCMTVRRSFALLVAGLVGGAVLTGLTGSQPSEGSVAGPAIRWQRVTFRGVSVRVPARWTVVRFSRDPRACPRFDRHAVYLGMPGPDPACPARLIGRTEAVLVSPLRGLPAPGSFTKSVVPALSPAGRMVMLTNRGWAAARDIIDALPGAGVAVSITFRADRALALAIQSSITVAARPHPAPSPQPGPSSSYALATARTALSAGNPVVSGSGFDACAAPGLPVMSKWLASPYRAIGVYIGGVNRACAQAYLTPAWLTSIGQQGWHYFPIYPGLQSSCVLASGDATISTSQAAAQGAAAASDAAAKAAALGIPRGSPLIYDMEAYAPACDGQVITFLSAWDARLHARGYLAGVYESETNIGALAAAAQTMTEPDVLYYADWDGDATTSSSYLPAGMWTHDQRLHQYLGGHNATYGGATLNIDSDQLDVRLATAVPAGRDGYAGYRIAVAVNANGTAEWFARTAGDTLVHSWQQPPGTPTWAPTHTVGNSPGDLVSNPSAVAQHNGALAVFVIDSAGHVEHAWQQAGAPNGWDWGTPLPATSGGSGPARPGTDPAAVLLPGGRVGVFETTTSGAVSVASQSQPDQNQAWTAWRSLGGTCASTPVPVVAQATVDVFCFTTGGTAAVNSHSGSSWSGWKVISGGPSSLTGVPAVTVSGAGVTELFAVTSGGQVADAFQPQGGGWTWGAPLAGPGSGIHVSGSPAAANWPAGSAIVYVAEAGGQIGYIRQLSTSGSPSWSSWATIAAAPGNAVLGTPAAWLSSGGAASAAVLDGNLMLATSNDSGSGWSPWTEVGGGF
jgi:hypothetical protein